jgi:uncharacterized membrane protein
MTDNPYAPPKAAVLEPASQSGTFVPDGRKVPSGRGVAWYGEAWDLFKAAPGTWVLICVIFIVLSIVVAIIPLGSLASSIAYPAIAAGLMLGCRSIEEGAGLTVGHLFAGFKKNVGNLLLVGVLYLVGTMLVFLFVGIGAAIAIPAVAMGGAVNPNDLASFMVLGPVIALIVLVALALMLPLFMAIWFAPALVIFHDLQPMAAMKASFQGALKNIVPFLLYGIVGLALAIVAMIPLGLGMLVWVPLLWASIYTSYRDIFLKRA